MTASAKAHGDRADSGDGVRLTRADVGFVVVLLVIVGVVRLYGMTAQSLWIDEINIVRFARYDTFAEFFAALPREPHPPLYLLIMRYWTAVFGYSAEALRSFSVLVSILTPATFYLLLRSRTGRATAAIAAVLIGFAAISHFQAHNARPYALIFWLGALALPFFLDTCAAIGGERAHRTWTLVALVTLNLLIGLTHYSGIVFVAAQGLVLFIQFCRNPERQWFRDVVWLAVLGASALPAFLWLAWTYGELATLVAGKSMGLTWQDYASPIRSVLGFPGYVPLLFLPFALGWTQLRATFAELWQVITGDRLFLLAAGVGVLHLVMVELTSLAQPSFMQNKMIYVVFPAFYVGLARYLLGVRQAGSTYRPVVYLLAATGLATYLVTGYPQGSQGYTSPWQEQEREGARHVAEVARPGDLVLLGSVSMNGTWVQPSQQFFEAIEPDLSLPEGAKAGVFPPIRDYATRQDELDAMRLSVLNGALARIGKDANRLIIDLPHRDELSVTEFDAIEQAGFCVQVTNFIQHRVVIVDPDVSACLRPQH
ncbi:MAG: glycosyltransferase family 39 protein [Alphaproteobacteria bacterium]